MLYDQKGTFKQYLASESYHTFINRQIKYKIEVDDTTMYKNTYTYIYTYNSEIEDCAMAKNVIRRKDEQTTALLHRNLRLSTIISTTIRDLNAYVQEG